MEFLISSSDNQTKGLILFIEYSSVPIASRCAECTQHKGPCNLKTNFSWWSQGKNFLMNIQFFTENSCPGDL
jgi:hypothetical protein